MPKFAISFLLGRRKFGKPEHTEPTFLIIKNDLKKAPKKAFLQIKEPSEVLELATKRNSSFVERVGKDKKDITEQNLLQNGPRTMTE